MHFNSHQFIEKKEKNSSDQAIKTLMELHQKYIQNIRNFKKVSFTLDSVQFWKVAYRPLNRFQMSLKQSTMPKIGRFNTNSFTDDLVTVLRFLIERCLNMKDEKKAKLFLSEKISVKNNNLKIFHLTFDELSISKYSINIEEAINQIIFESPNYLLEHLIDQLDILRDKKLKEIYSIICDLHVFLTDEMQLSLEETKSRIKNLLETLDIADENIDKLEKAKQIDLILNKWDFGRDNHKHLNKLSTLLNEYCFFNNMIYLMDGYIIADQQINNTHYMSGLLDVYKEYQKNNFNQTFLDQNIYILHDSVFIAHKKIDILHINILNDIKEVQKNKSKNFKDFFMQHLNNIFKQLRDMHRKKFNDMILGFNDLQRKKIIEIIGKNNKLDINIKVNNDITAISKFFQNLYDLQIPIDHMDHLAEELKQMDPMHNNFITEYMTAIKNIIIERNNIDRILIMLKQKIPNETPRININFDLPKVNKNIQNKTPLIKLNFPIEIENSQCLLPILPSWNNTPNRKTILQTSEKKLSNKFSVPDFHLPPLRPFATNSNKQKTQEKLEKSIGSTNSNKILGSNSLSSYLPPLKISGDKLEQSLNSLDKLLKLNTSTNSYEKNTKPFDDSSKKDNIYPIVININNILCDSNSLQKIINKTQIKNDSNQTNHNNNEQYRTPSFLSFNENVDFIKPFSILEHQGNISSIYPTTETNFDFSKDLEILENFCTNLKLNLYDSKAELCCQKVSEIVSKFFEGQCSLENFINIVNEIVNHNNEETNYLIGLYSKITLTKNLITINSQQKISLNGLQIAALIIGFINVSKKHIEIGKIINNENTITLLNYLTDKLEFLKKNLDTEENIKNNDSRLDLSIFNNRSNVIVNEETLYNKLFDVSLRSLKIFKEFINEKFQKSQNSTDVQDYSNKDQKSLVNKFDIDKICRVLNSIKELYIKKIHENDIQVITFIQNKINVKQVEGIIKQFIVTYNLNQNNCELLVQNYQKYSQSTIDQKFKFANMFEGIQDENIISKKKQIIETLLRTVKTTLYTSQEIQKDFQKICELIKNKHYAYFEALQYLDKYGFFVDEKIIIGQINHIISTQINNKNK